MTTVPVSETKVAQVKSELAVTSGCSDHIRDMLGLVWSEPHGYVPPKPGTGPGWPDTLPVGRAVTACLYDSQAAAGPTLVAAATLTPAAYETVRTELRASVAASSCNRADHTRFVHLEGVGGPDFTEVALDGCGVQAGAGFWQGTDALRSTLADALRVR